MHGWGHGEMPSIEFSVLAETSHGSTVRAVGSLDSLGQWDPSCGLTLHTGPGEYPRWSATARIPHGRPAAEYKFVVVEPDGSAVWEEGGNRALPPGASGNAEAQTPVFRKACFAPVRGSTSASSPKTPKPAPAPVAPAPAAAAGEYCEAASGDCGEELLFEAVCTNTAPGDIVRVVGSSSALGNWDPKRGLLLTTSATSFPRWSGNASIPRGSSSLEWKLIMCRADGSVLWEPGDNRHTVLQPGWDGSWLVRVHFGGACGAPEQCTSLRPRSKSQPGTPSQGTAKAAPAPLRRYATELGTPPMSSSWMVAAPVLAPVPAAPPTAAPAPAASPEEPPEAAPKQWARSSSLSHFGALLGAEGSSSLSLSFNRSRSRNTGPAMEDQLVTLTLDGVDPERAAAATVEAVMETDGSKWRLRLDPPEAGATQARWTLSLGETGLTTGLHLLHFLVCGKRCLSRDLPVFGESNAVLFSEPLRRYILARDERQQDGNEHVPLNHSRTSERLTGGGGLSGLARSGGGFSDDTDLEMPGQRHGNMPRPFSICGNLVALGDDEDEGGGLDSKNNLANFSKEVFEGLYDGELRLRMDGYMLPEPVALHRPQPLKMWSGAHLLKKKVGACEDAFFNEDHAMGVADGVGCMVQFASYGINAAAYAAELMTQAAKSFHETAAADVRDSVEQRAKTALMAAEQGAQAYGASTITCLALDGNSVGVANLGDSGFLHLRKGHRGMQVIRRSEEQQHSWNCPYQLTRLPPALSSKFPKLCLDSASDCDQYSFNVREGDLILIFTDGLRDNLYEREVLHIVDCALSPAFGELVGLREQSTTPDRLARSLALAAYERSLDASAKVPFVEYSKKHGYDCQGGKQDDITVVAAWVLPQEQPSMDTALAAVAEAPLAPPEPLPSEPAAKPAEPAAEPPAAEPLVEPAAERMAPVPNADAGPSEAELKEIIARTETLMFIGAEDTEPSPAGATGAGQALKDAEDAALKGKAAESPPRDAEVTNSHTNGLGASKGSDNFKSKASEDNTSDDCKAPSQETVSPARPTGGELPSTPPHTDGARMAVEKRPVQPTYETPRRSSFESPSPATGTQRRSTACRAEFRPMSSSSKGHESSKGRGGTRGGRRVQG